MVAGKEGLFIRDIKADEPIEVSEGYSLSSFAPWSYMKDRWHIKGDFALPAIRDRKEYESLGKDPAKAVKKGILHGF